MAARTAAPHQCYDVVVAPYPTSAGNLIWPPPPRPPPILRHAAFRNWGICPGGNGGRERMELRERLNDSLKSAMKARDHKRVSTLRLMLAGLKDRDIANRSEESRAGIGEDEIFSLLAKMIRQREESASMYES